VNELQLIDAFLAPFGLSRGAKARGWGVLSGPGDDCAVVLPAPGKKLVLKVDELVEGVHFDFRWFAPADVGHKALAVSLSDLAAAGARPRWFLCALGVPRDAVSMGVARGVARGMARLARRHGCALVGGNVTRARRWSLAVTAMGEAERPRGRSGARPGDALIVAGELGRAALGLRLLRQGRRGSAVRAQLRPEPLVAAGVAAGRFAAASIDVSDGFLRDLGHLCAASRCGAEVRLEDLPQQRLRDALSGGEDYALLFAARPPDVRRLVSALRRTGTQAREVGRFVPGRGVRLLSGGKVRPLPARLGWDHLA